MEGGGGRLNPAEKGSGLKHKRQNRKLLLHYNRVETNDRHISRKKTRRIGKGIRGEGGFSQKGGRNWVSAVFVALAGRKKIGKRGGRRKGPHSRKKGRENSLVR